MVLSDWGISDTVPDDARFPGVGLSFFRYFWLDMGLMVCELFDHMRVILCLRVKNCLLIMSGDPITQGPKTSWIEYYVLFPHGPSGFSRIMCLQSLTFRVVLSMYLWLGDGVYKLTLYCLIGSSEKSSTMCNRVCYLSYHKFVKDFLPFLCEWSRMDAWERNHRLYGSFQHPVCHLSIQRRMKSR